MMGFLDGYISKTVLVLVVILQAAILVVRDGGGPTVNEVSCFEQGQTFLRKAENATKALENTWMGTVASLKKQREKLEFKAKKLSELRTLLTPVCEDVDDTFWIGDTLVWNNTDCGQYEVKKREIWDKKVLLVGDSLARRFSITLADTLAGNTSLEVLGRDKYTHSKLLNISGQNIDFRWGPCVGNMANITKKYGHAYDVVILSTAIHHVPGTRGDCMERDFENEFDRYMLPQLRSLKEKIWWRTEPLSSRLEVTDRLQAIYNHIMDYREEITVLDHFKMVLPRTTGKERISGNTPDHFGTSARIAMVQHFLKQAPNLFFNDRRDLESPALINMKQ